MLSIRGGGIEQSLDKNRRAQNKYFVNLSDNGSLELKLTDKRMPYYARSGHDGKPFSYEVCKFFADLEALVLFVNSVKTMQFDVLIAGGCSKHHMALIPLFPVTVSWTMYEKTSNQNKDFLTWKDKQPNVRVCSR
jgi:hypothetical protein